MSDEIPDLAELGAIFHNDRSFVLRIVQPGLSGLMDGSVSTLAKFGACSVARSA